MANQETDELDCKRKEIEKLSLLNELLRRDKERLEDELSDMFTALHNTDSEAEQCVGGLEVFEKGNIGFVPGRGSKLLPEQIANSE